MKPLFLDYELDHIGIAVHSLDSGEKFYQALGFEVGHREEVPSEKVRVSFLTLKNNANIELLEPLSEESAIYKFLQSRGPGFHHFCLRVPLLEEVQRRLLKEGIPLIYKEARQGAHGCLVNFIHPRYAGGVLVELSQKLIGD